MATLNYTNFISCCRSVTEKVLTIFLLLVVVAGAQAQELTAEESVINYVDALLVEVEEIKDLYVTDRDQYFAGIEQSLLEFVDFREVARGVMARYGTGENGATDEQLTRFSEVFKTSMVDFYGSALASYGGEDYEIVANRRAPRNPANATNVRMILMTLDGARIELQYTMFLTEDQVWKMKNLYVEGVNLRRQYYSRFDSQMARYDYDIDAVIDNWLASE